MRTKLRCRASITRLKTGLLIHRNYNLHLTLLSARLNKSFAAVSENVSSGGGHPSGFEIKFSKIFFSFSSIGIVASSELGSISGLKMTHQMTHWLTLQILIWRIGKLVINHVLGVVASCAWIYTGFDLGVNWGHVRSDTGVNWNWVRGGRRNIKFKFTPEE